MKNKKQEISDLKQLFDFHTKIGNKGRASMIKSRIEKLKSKN